MSPLLHARVDLAQYATGVASLKNFLILPQGGLANRPGTKVLGSDYYSESVRLVPFVYSSQDSLVLVFYDGKVDVYSYTGRQNTIHDSPYDISHLKQLRYVQSADILFLFHPKIPPYTLKRYDDTNWKFEPLKLDKGPFRDMNTDEAIKVEVVTNPAARETVAQSTEPIFYPALAGTLLKVEQKVKPWTGQYAFSEKAPKTWITPPVFGAFSYRTNGKWRGSLEVYRAQREDWEGLDENDPYAWPSATWKPFKSYFSDTDAEENFSFSGAVEEYATFFKFVREIYDRRVVLTFDFEGGLVPRIFRITKVEQSDCAHVTPLDGLTGNIEYTTNWAFGAFGEAYGYPSLGVFHQERLVLANTPTDPQTLWMSQPASWENFGTSIPTKDDDSISATLASKQVNEIVGLSSRGDLLIFTSGAEFTAKAGAKTDAFTPSSLVITPSGYRGAKPVPTLDVGSSVLFVQRDGRTVRALGYSLEIDNYSASDLSVLAEHLFKNSSIKSWTYQQAPWGIVWVVLEDKTLLALTLNQDHQITGLGRHDLRADILDVCTIPGKGQDDVFFATRREGLISIERLRERIDGLNYRPEDYADAGTNTVQSEVELLDWEQQVGGTLQGRHKGVQVATIRVYKTKRIRAGVVNENNNREDNTEKLDEKVFDQLLTGDVRFILPGGVARRCKIKIENDDPVPITILGVFPEVDIYADGQSGEG